MFMANVVSISHRISRWHRHVSVIDLRVKNKDTMRPIM